MQYQIPKGLFDILPYGAQEEWQQTHKWQFIEEIIRKTAQDYGYKEIRTPIFEKTEVFLRSIGETSDIVSKEMYTFLDKADRSMTLRPEGTASVMRAFVENNLQSLGGTHKLYYIGPMFRYDRPQAGRYRQHHQFGIEAIGNSSYEQEAEGIDLLLELFRRLEIKNIKLLINSIGDDETRKNYIKAFAIFLKPNIKNLSKDSQERLEKNPLRILDSKDPNDIEILKNSPSILEYLSSNSKNHFENLLKLLGHLKVAYQIDSKLVRGLDYYNDTVFEVVANSIGSQSSLGGGGKYDRMVKKFNGPDIPGFGFGMGMERVLQVMHNQNIVFPQSPAPLIFFIPMDEKSKDLALEYATALRHKQISCDIELSTFKLQKALQHATRLSAKYAAIIGEEEIKNKQIQLKNLSTREQKEIPFTDFISFMEKQNNISQGQKHV